MMTHAEVRASLDEFVDRVLPPDQTRQIEEHLACCSKCRASFARLTQILNEAVALRTREVSPARDLWPAIRDRLEGATAPGRPRWLDSMRAAFRPRRLAWLVPVLAAVALVYIVIGRDSGQYRQLEPVNVPGLATLEVETARTRQDVEAALRLSEGTLPPDATSQLKQNLLLLDQAIRDARAAVDANPGQPGLQRSLLTAYQKQLDLLRWATRLMQQS